MAVSEITTPNGKVYIRSGDPDYFAVVDPSLGAKPVIDIRFQGGKYQVLNKTIIEPNYSHPLFGRGPDPENPIRTDLEVFFLTLYFADVFLGYDQFQNNLDADIKAAGLVGDYDSVNVVDFMVLTGAKERNYRKPDNTMQDIMMLGPTDERPKMDEVEDTGEGNQLMVDIIKYRGLLGLLPHLYAAKAITFENLLEIVEHFYPDIAERNAYYASELGPMLKLKQAPLFNTAQLQKLKLL